MNSPSRTVLKGESLGEIMLQAAKRPAGVFKIDRESAEKIQNRLGNAVAEAVEKIRTKERQHVSDDTIYY